MSSSDACDGSPAPTTARIFFQALDYRRTLEAAGVMPCLHVAVVRSGSSGNSMSGSGSWAGNSYISYEHHAIFDRERDQYIHVTVDDAGESRVIQEARRKFESNYSQRPRVIKQPATIHEAHEILVRARAWAMDAEWEYCVMSRNCEHFVNECWNPSETASSTQVWQAAASIGGSGLVGAIGGGATGSVAAAFAAVTTTATQPFYALGFIPWGTTTATVVTNLPVGAVIGIGAGSVVVGAGVFGGIAYGVRELVHNHTASNDELVPIAIYNKSGHAVTASLQNEDSVLFDWLYRWRALIGVGSMSTDVETEMTEELNPPTVWDSGETQFELSVTGKSFEPKTCMVKRGDVVTFDGAALKHAPRPEPLPCEICYDRPHNVILTPCSHHMLCEDCVLQIKERNSECPFCREKFEEYLV